MALEFDPFVLSIAYELQAGLIAIFSLLMPTWDSLSSGRIWSIGLRSSAGTVRGTPDGEKEFKMGRKWRGAELLPSCHTTVMCNVQTIKMQ